MSTVCLTFAVYHGNTLLRREELNQKVIRIGKDARSHLRLDEPAAGRMHAVLEVARDNDVTLIDLGHDAGTYVNGTRVDKCRLVKGDELKIGDTRFVLERMAMQSDYVAPATEVPSMALDANPFLAPRHDFFSAKRQGLALGHDGTEDDYTYAMVRSGPAVDPDEVELVNVPAVEVMVLWGQNVLHVAHLRPGESFAVGEEQSKHLTCDFFIPAEKLGTTRLPIVVSGIAAATTFIPENATGRVELVGQPAMPLQELRERPDLCQEVPGGHELSLIRGTKLRIDVADFVIRVSAVNAGKPAKKGLAAGVDWAAFTSFGMSVGAVGSFLATMAFFTPNLVDLEDSEASQDQLILMQQFLVAAAEREQEMKPAEEVTDENADDQEGGTGTRAQDEEGSMGNPTSRETNRRYAVKGDKNNPDPHLARDAAIAEARTFGTIGLLNAGLAGDPNAPTAPWGRDDSLGTDDVSARGNMWGDDIGDAYGAGGLGLTGIGEGGGGYGEGIGLGNIGGLGHGAGLGDGQGMGRGHGRLARGHNSKAPGVMRPGKTEVSGRLPPEVIQRIVRQNYGRFRMCYEQGLARNPNLEGRVQVRFVINREGTVSNVQNGGSDLPDSAVTSCIISAYYGLSFPQPEGGIVTVSYPIMFQPG
jgi:hypothetical protein